MSVPGAQSVLIDNLLPFGAQADDLRLFDTDGPGLLPYATLLSARVDELANVPAVYVWQNAPLIFSENFAYLGSTTGPGPVAIWHLWLS